ncbi:MAG: hypothetical protein FWC83_01935 [Alphaproteobacteria bacterium]|nr:hypothetical protein [Alphaproteobacteria bacterium]
MTVNKKIKGEDMVKKDALKNASDRIAEESKTVASAAAARMREKMTTPVRPKKSAPASVKTESVIKESGTMNQEPVPALIATTSLAHESRITNHESRKSTGQHIGNGIDWIIAKTRAILTFVFITLPTRFWNWVQRINIIGLGNIALLLAIIIMFSLLIGRVWNMGERTVSSMTTERTVRERPAAPTAEAPTRLRVPANVIIDKNANRMTVELPLQPIAQPIVRTITERPQPRRIVAEPVNPHLRTIGGGREQAGRLVARVWTHGDMIVDGSRPGDGNLRAGTSVRGNLFLQNHRRITLPCGVFIDGDLHVRNVGLLQFCNDFTITGNIYVSSNSTFGPIPRTARLGGTVIF